MGTSGNWLKLFIPHRKSTPNDQEKTFAGKKSKKWKLWRSSSSSEASDKSRTSVNRGQAAASVSSTSDSTVAEDVYSAAMATLVRAPPKDFRIIRQEWAAIRIQTAFRGLLARRAFRALKALVRLQAIVRGRLVRKRAAVTLKCMQALVRAQAQVKAHRVRMSLEGESLHKKPENQSHPVKPAEGARTKLQSRDRATKSTSNSMECDSTRAAKSHNPQRVASASYCSNTESSLSSSTAFEGTTEDSASSASVASLSKPRYMSLTVSNRAKQREGGVSKSRFREAPLVAHHCNGKSGLRFSGEVKRASVDSAPCSVAASEDHCPPKLSLDRYEWTRCR